MHAAPCFYAFGTSSREMSSIAYRRPTVLGYPILCVPLVISIRLKWEYPKWSCSLYLLSIPSHPIPSHPIMYPTVPGTEWEHPKLYHPPCLHPYCPSHPNVPWEGRDRVGTSQTVPPTICIPTVHPIPMYHGKEGME